MSGIVVKRNVSLIEKLAAKIAKAGFSYQGEEDVSNRRILYLAELTEGKRLEITISERFPDHVTKRVIVFERVGNGWLIEKRCLKTFVGRIRVERCSLDVSSIMYWIRNVNRQMA
jgi:hypothetical protein